MKASLLTAGAVVAAGWAYLRHVQLPMGPSRMNWGSQVFGHRGCRMVAHIPENTIPAFRYAKERGATGVELDIRLTKDNELVVFHDAFFNHHMVGVDAKARVDEMELFQVKQLKFVEDPTGDVRIPTLEETVLFCRENNLKMLIEIKELARPKVCVAKLLALYRRYPEFLYAEATVIAFNPGVLYRLRAQDRDVAVGQLYCEDLITSWVTSGVETCPWFFRAFPSAFDKLVLLMNSKLYPWLSGVSLVCPKYTLFTPAMKRMWHSRHIGVYLWGFPNPITCTMDMRVPGVLVACDDLHEQFHAPTVPLNEDVFDDEAREAARLRELSILESRRQERQKQQQRHEQQRLSE